MIIDCALVAVGKFGNWIWFDPPVSTSADVSLELPYPPAIKIIDATGVGVVGIVVVTSGVVATGVVVTCKIKSMLFKLSNLCNV